MSISQEPAYTVVLFGYAVDQRNTEAPAETVKEVPEPGDERLVSWVSAGKVPWTASPINAQLTVVLPVEKLTEVEV